MFIRTLITEVAINNVCDIADTATDQCSDTKTACSEDSSGAKKCLCTSDYYVSSTTCQDSKLDFSIIDIPCIR
jgi:hypothetical protein